MIPFVDSGDGTGDEHHSKLVSHSSSYRGPGIVVVVVPVIMALGQRHDDAAISTISVSIESTVIRNPRLPMT
jgi:hypothetical protein